MEGAMDPTTEEESDGLDDTEFITQQEKYQEYCTNRTSELLKAEEERLNVTLLPVSSKNDANVIIFSKFEMS
jgi:hypothetical protein